MHYVNTLVTLVEALFLWSATFYGI